MTEQSREDSGGHDTTRAEIHNAMEAGHTTEVAAKPPTKPEVVPGDSTTKKP